MAYLPMAVYGLEVPAGDVAISARPDIPSAFNITMAAIDPSAEAEGAEGAPQRATLKIIRQPLGMDEEDDDEDDEDFDADEMERMLAEESSDDDESEDDEEANGAGPSDPAKSKKARKAAAQEAIRKLLAQDEMDVDEAKTNGANGKSAKALGKMPASDEEDSEDDESMEGGEIEEFVICTLNPSNTYQQPLNLTIGEDERVWFKVSGTHTIFLTGNYIEPAHDHSHGEDDDEEDDYDLSPDEDELDDEYDSEEDELDGMDDPRITEVEDEEDAPALVEAPKKADAKKGKNKRAADDETLDSMMTEAKVEPTDNGEPKLSKKQQKKLKKNDGTATTTTAVTEEAPSKSDKKVQFAKNLEQGPTPTKAAEADKKDDKKAALGVKVVQGVTIDDKKAGTGPAAKNGDRVGMRYIGKLQKNGKVFDSNKKGKPFTFKLGSGEVIKGWDIGVAGMSVGGERRITLPPHHGYGSRGAPPDIPGNATLVFDVKVVEINKGK